MGPETASWITGISRGLGIVVVCVQLAGCQHTTNYAPVTDLSLSSTSSISSAPSTKKLYAQHVTNKADVKSVKPIKIAYQAPLQQVVFQRVNVPQPDKREHPQVQSEVKPEVKPEVKVVIRKQVNATAISLPAKIKLIPDVPSWVSPANGRIAALYSPRHRGIDISGRLGDPVYAISSGNIVYAGNGLRGYGNLIIIKHNNEYLSTYAYNKSIKVKAGEWVKKGQTIGEMGYKDKNKVMLYFELRRNGQPIDPLSIRGIMN